MPHWGRLPNAFTSYDMTAYYFSCTDHFEACLRLLLEFVSTPYFTEESVEKERGIIDQEIGMNEDAPDSRVFENLVQSLYREHPVRVPILGTSTTIREITPEVLNRCHRAFYSPENMLLCVVGDVEPEDVCRIADEVLGSIPGPAGEKLRPWQEDMTAAEPEIAVSMEVAMPMFNLAFKCESLGKGEKAIRTEMVADLAAEALFGESSELYLRLYEQGLIDSSFGGGFETIDGCAHAAVLRKIPRIPGQSGRPSWPRDGCWRSRACRKKTFQRMKRSALGRRIRSLDSFDATCFRVCAYHFSDFDYFRFPEVYRSITAGEIRDFLDQVIRPERCSLSVVYPLENEGGKRIMNPLNYSFHLLSGPGAGSESAPGLDSGPLDHPSVWTGHCPGADSGGAVLHPPQPGVRSNPG